MIKRFVYIVFLLVSTPCLLLAKTKTGLNERALLLRSEFTMLTRPLNEFADTVKTNKSQARADVKVKELSKAKKQPKPEKVDEPAPTDPKAKAKRQRRPEGMERPPEIPRRNDN